MMPLAAVVTAGLFLVMGGLIQNDMVILDEVEPTPPIDIFRGKTDEPLPETVFPDPTDLPDVPDLPKQEYPTVDPNPIIDPIPGPGKGSETIIDTGPIQLGLAGALITPAPQYPSTCLQRGVEGRATVVFDVTNNGQVINERIVSSSHSCFERPSLRAIRNWKFRSRGNGGTGIAERGVRKTFVFNIDG
jgi:protein TonB